MRIYDIISGSILAIGSFLMIWFIIPAETSSGEGFAVSPAMLPNVSMGVVLILSVTLVLGRVIGFGARIAAPMERQHWVALLAFAAILTAGYIGFRYFGFIVGGMALVLLFLIYIGERKISIIVGTTVGAPLVLYAFFWKLLTISLP